MRSSSGCRSASRRDHSRCDTNAASDCNCADGVTTRRSRRLRSLLWHFGSGDGADHAKRNAGGYAAIAAATPTGFLDKIGFASNGIQRCRPADLRLRGRGADQQRRCERSARE